MELVIHGKPAGFGLVIERFGAGMLLGSGSVVGGVPTIVLPLTGNIVTFKSPFEIAFVVAGWCRLMRACPLYRWIWNRYPCARSRVPA